MAATRDRRNNAGSRIARLLNEEEEEDDFYKTQYGGFNEEKADDDYLANEDDRDIVDSDFSIDENDELVTDDEDQANRPKRRKKVVTRSYKEPTKSSKKPISPKKKFVKSEKRTDRLSPDAKKSLRKSTTAKSAATQHRLKARHEAERMKPKMVRNDDPLPTQEELLEEASQTEKENLLSLEKFRRMELEKKKVRPTKGTTYVGPIIRYHSVSMPVIQDETKVKEVIQDDHEETKRTTRRSRMAANDAAKAAEKGRCERTFISFVNDINNKVFDGVFPPKSKRPRQSRICPVTKMPAKYFDPITQLPYYNIMAFKILRESYYQMLESNSDQNDPRTAEWLSWRKKWKETRAKPIKIEP
ncbi:CLUMA_CG001699, isoform A [Clunio marinus]|uniref:Vacuolar protein sorting-associated protein 72 homolog n=1 Tax=Clunio marinus TaxID=568069 RepID=A0A1J1HIN3_9DIPT|nr:CLUMA_CG001699, isoform A [Clunio marinus]